MTTKRKATNYIAASLSNPLFKPRVVRNRKKYRRKIKFNNINSEQVKYE